MRIVARFVVAVVALGLAPWLGPAAAGAAKEGRCEVSQIRGDFDGDGARDTAYVFVPRPRCNPDRDGTELYGQYRLSVVLANGTRIGRRVWHRFERCAVTARADLNRDGRDEIAVGMDAGASTESFGIFTLQDTGLERARLVGPRPRHRFGTWITFGLYGSVNHQSDFRCRTTPDGRPFVVSFGFGVNQPFRPRYDVSETRFWFDGRDFRYASEAHWSRPAAGDHGEDYPVARGEPCLDPAPRF